MLPVSPSPARAARARSFLLRATGTAALLALAALGGCAVYPAGGAVATVGSEVYVDAAPPAPIYESVTVAPAVGYVWVPGYWNWYGGRYVWNAGRWNRPPQGYNHWRPGQWQRTPRGHRWIGGQWDNRGNRGNWGNRGNRGNPFIPGAQGQRLPPDGAGRPWNPTRQP